MRNELPTENDDFNRGRKSLSNFNWHRQCYEGKFIKKILLHSHRRWNRGNNSFKKIIFLPFGIGIDST